jgi:hypothetical protein
MTSVKRMSEILTLDNINCSPDLATFVPEGELLAKGEMGRP